MGNGFGEKLRAERLERGLTQAELGKNLYSPSYISLLETGRREPTAEVIEELARRLELAPKALEAWSQPVSVSDAEYVLAGLYARQAWDLRDYQLAASHAATAAQIALEAKNNSAWWNMTYMQAECVMKQGQLKECQQIVEHLLEHPMATESAGLGVRAWQMLAAVCHGQGQLATAVEHAKQAVKLSEQLPKGSTLIIGAHRALIGALAESGKLDEAWEYCLAMIEHMDEHSMSQLAGEVAWVVGNVAFMRHDYVEGIKHHERAAKLLSPPMTSSCGPASTRPRQRYACPPASWNRKPCPPLNAQNSRCRSWEATRRTSWRSLSSAPGGSISPATFRPPSKSSAKSIPTARSWPATRPAKFHCCWVSR